jgi:diguanylate cyclase (GGDEF)-like protein
LRSLSQLVASHVKNAIMYETIITDYLTGLYTRDYFIKRLEKEFAKIKELGGDLSFVMIDLDDFSKINNTYGHNEGDRVLRQVAHVLKGVVRSTDIVGRFGGEEMIVILPNTNAMIAKTMAEGMLDALRAMTVEGDRYRLTASVGVGNYLLDQPVDITDLIEKADRAETRAKQEGKNRVYCHWELQGNASGESNSFSYETRGR